MSDKFNYYLEVAQKAAMSASNLQDVFRSHQRMDRRNGTTYPEDVLMFLKNLGYEVEVYRKKWVHVDEDMNELITVFKITQKDETLYVACNGEMNLFEADIEPINPFQYRG